MANVGEALKAAIRSDGRSYRAIYDAAHVNKRTFERFMKDDDNSTGNIRLETVQKLAVAVGLTFRPIVSCDLCIWEDNKADIAASLRVNT